MNNKQINWQNRPINVVLGHCCGVTLADFEQITNNDFVQVETE